MYKKFFEDCIQGKIGYKCDFHILDSSKSDNNNNNNNGKVLDVSIVSPTQAAVDQARSELKQEMYINEPTSSKHIQSGGNGYRRQIKKIKIKPQSVKRKREVNNKKRGLKKKSKTNLKLMQRQ